MTDDPKKNDAEGGEEDQSEGWDEAEKVADSIRPPPPPAEAEPEPKKAEAKKAEPKKAEPKKAEAEKVEEDEESDDDAHDHLEGEAHDGHHHEHDDLDGDDHDGEEDEDDDGPRKPPKKRPALLLAQFETTADVVHAAEKVRDAGYTQWDTHSPFPIHGMDKAMGLKDSFLGLIVFCGGAAGVTTAVTMIWWMNGVDYPIIIGGKPPFSLPSSVPIMFELMVLFSALTTVFGMFGINKLPRHHHPIFESERFRASTDDKFFISVEADDPKFDPERTKAFLGELNPTSIELLEEEVDDDDDTEEHH
jgi:hypothetical protein